MSIYLISQNISRYYPRDDTQPSSRQDFNHLGGGQVVKTWDQEVYFLCGFRFESCGCSYDGHWKLTWSLTSGPLRLVEVHASYSGYPR